MTNREANETRLKVASLEYASFPISLLGKGDRRLDGESYLSGGYAIRMQIQQSGVPYDLLGDMAKVWYPGRLKGTTVSAEDGVPYLTATQVFDIRPSARKFLARGTFNQSELSLQRDCILVTRSGSVGDVIIAGAAHLDCVVSDDLLRVQAEEQCRGYLYLFLRSLFGRTMMRSGRYGSVIKHLEPEHLLDIPVPALDDAIYAELNRRVNKIYELRDKAFELTKAAEATFGAAIGTLPSVAAEETGYEVKASELFSTRRLDGYHHNPTAQAVLEAFKKAGLEPVLLSTVVKDVFGVPRFKHVYTGTGIPYLDSEDIFKISPELTKFIPEVTKKDADRYYVAPGWILMACSGQLYGLNGSCMLADRWHENKIVSNHVVRIVPSPDGVRPGYLQVALGHPVYGRPLVLRTAYGTSVPEITPEDMRRFPLVRLSPEVEDTIAESVEMASSLRMQADEEENDAIQLLEDVLQQRLHTKLEPTSAD